ncbi:MAG: ABC transporter permease [Ardenticatenaceae bacterium]|nr:ABC transporter permease [Ardenticatenaceae bacterium]MCB9445196.1 ABC transporter permease [Ardenticatenaceae bacterium]
MSPETNPSSTTTIIPSQSSPTHEEEVDSIYVAPNWKLVWWRFKKHRLALASTFIVILVAVVAIIPSFFSTQAPDESVATELFIPPQRVHFFDDGHLRLFVYAVIGVRNPNTLRMEWEVNPDEKIYLQLFAQGYSHKVLGFETNRHFIGLKEPESGAPFHLLGTDRLGRDEWSRLMYGTRTSLSIGLLAVIISTILGIILGGLSGYYGGTTDMIIQRLIELLQSLPAIPIWLALSAAMPRTWSVEQTYLAITVILALIGWTTLAREIRSRFLSLREEDFVVAAKLSGSKESRVVFRHMMPTMYSHIIAAVTLAIPVMIISETFLSFLGLGLRPPAISWGVLLQEAQNLQSIALAPWLLLPGLAVIITVLAMNIMGDGLRDAADPYSH